MAIVIKNFWQHPKPTYGITEFEFGYTEYTGRDRAYKISMGEDAEAFHHFMWAVWQRGKKNHLPWQDRDVHKFKPRVHIEPIRGSNC